VPLVGIFGMNPVDWMLATTLPGKTCKDVAGQSVGVDAIGGARSTALHSMLARGCPGVKIGQVKQVALGSNTATAMIAGTLSYGVLHLSDVAVIEAHRKKLHVLLAEKKTSPLSHHILYVARRDRVAANREAYVRTLAGLIAANRFMQDPKNAAAVAKIATVTGLSETIAKTALTKYLAIHSWSTKTDGMAPARIKFVIKLMKKIGGIKPGKQPVPYNKLIDPGIWKAADARVK
jgi:ABC-type nitrate/sulfonate/bicarbonate transport system substrate-binding protein